MPYQSIQASSRSRQYDNVQSRVNSIRTFNTSLPRISKSNTQGRDISSINGKNEDSQKTNLENELFGGIKRKKNNHIQNAIDKTNVNDLKQQKKVTVNQFKENNIGRIGESYKEARYEFGDRNKQIQLNMQEQFANQQKDERLIVEREQQAIQQQESQKQQNLLEAKMRQIMLNQRSMIKITKSLRGIIQVYKNVYIFYDKRLETQLKDIRQYTYEKIHTLTHNGILHNFFKDISNHVLNNTLKTKKEDYKIDLNQFVQLCKSVYLLGPTQFQLKREIEKSKCVALSNNVLPYDFIYAQNFNRDQQQLGMTIAYKSETQKTIIEFPLEQEKCFMIFNFVLLNEEGEKQYVRKVYEIIRDKKLKVLMNQSFDFVGELSEEDSTLEQSLFFINSKRATFEDEIDYKAIEKQEKQKRNSELVKVQDKNYKNKKTYEFKANFGVIQNDGSLQIPEQLRTQGPTNDLQKIPKWFKKDQLYEIQEETIRPQKYSRQQKIRQAKEIDLTMLKAQTFDQIDKQMYTLERRGKQKKLPLNDSTIISKKAAEKPKDKQVELEQQSARERAQQIIKRKKQEEIALPEIYFKTSQEERKMESLSLLNKFQQILSKGSIVNENSIYQ